MADKNNTSTVDDQMSAALGPRIERPEASTNPYTLQSLFTPEDMPAVKTEEAEVITAPTPVPLTDFNFEGKGLLGTGMAVERKVPVDWTLTTPKLSIEDVLPFDNESYREKFTSFNEYENAQGEVVDVTGMSIEDRIDVANKFGAVRFGIYDETERFTVDIPWEDAVSKFTRFPEGFQILGGPIRFETEGMTKDQYENLVMANRFGSTMLNPSPELGRAIHAQYLNEVLIKNGIDARGRALIINQEMEEYGVNQFGRIVSGASEILGRGSLEMTMWAVGETADWMNWAGEGLGLLRKSDMSGTIADYKTRQGAIDDMWKPAAYRVQDSFAQQNVIISLATAEDLVRAHSGMLPKAVQLGIEIAGPTKAVLLRQGLVAKGEIRAYRTWREGQLKSRPNMTEDALLEEWKANRRDLFGFVSARKKSVDDRFVLAYQIEDSLLPVAERANVRQQQSYHRSLFSERDAAIKRLEQAQEKPNVSEVELSNLRNRIVDLDRRIQVAEYDTFAVQRRSFIPEFIRQSNIQDKFIIVGATAGSHYFEDFNDSVDPALGELLGIGLGISLYVGNGLKRPALNAIAYRMTTDDRKKLSFISDELSKQNPSIKVALELQAVKLGQYKDKLIALGVDPDVLDTPLSIATDLMALRHFSESTIQRISVSKTLDSTVVADLQKTADINIRLAGQLNRIITDMRGLESGEATTALIETLEYFQKQAQLSHKRLNDYLGVIDKESVGHYMNALSGNSQAVPGTGPLSQGNAEVLSFPEALDALHARNLANAVDEVELKNMIDDHDNFINTELTTAGQNILSKTGDVNTARASLENQEDLSIPSGTSTGGLFSVILENAHSSAKAAAQAPYKFLDNNAIFLSTRGDEFAAGSLTVDVNDIFDQVFAITEETLPITRKESPGLKANDLKTLDSTLESITTPFFDSMAQANGTTPEKFVDGLLDGINAKREADGLAPLTIPKNRNKQVVVAKAMLEYADIDAFRVTPSVLRELQQTVGALRFRLRGNADAQQRLETLDNTIESRFDNFEADGVPIGQLYIKKPNGETVELSKYMAEAKANYSEYKANWYDLNDSAVIPQLMSWGSRMKTDATGANPGSVRYKKPTKEFLNPAKYSDENSANRFMLSMERTLGRKIMTSDGTLEYRLVLGETQTNAVQSVISADVGKYIVDNIETMTTEQLIQYVKSVEKNLRAVDATGKSMPLINVMAVMDEVFTASEKTYKKQLWDKATDQINRKIKDTVTVATRDARSQRDATGVALKVLEETYGREMTLQSFGKAIASGNANDIRGFRQILNDATIMSDDLKDFDVDEIMAQAYIEYMQTSIFPTTGRSIGTKVKNEKGEELFNLTAEFDTDVKALKEALGGNEPTRKASVRMILGEERYEVWQTMYSYLAELNDNPLARNASVTMQGAPRSLSIESYISRLYAINRNVVRPQYVATEATIQALRTKKFNFLLAALTDPELGNLFIEMMRTGKPLTAKQNVRFEQLLIQGYGQQIGLEGGILETPIVDPAGRTFTSYATPKEKERFIGDSRITGKLDIPSLDSIQFP